MPLNLVFQSQDVLGISFLVCFPKLFHLIAIFSVCFHTSCVFSSIISSKAIFSGLFHVLFYVPMKGWLCQWWVERTLNALQTKFPFPWEHSQLAEVRCDHLKPHRLLPHHLFPHFLSSIWWFLPSKCTFWAVSPALNSGCIFQSASLSVQGYYLPVPGGYFYSIYGFFQWKHWINPKLFC